MRKTWPWALLLVACAAEPAAVETVVFSGSEVGAEGEVLRRQLARFQAENPSVRVELRVTPDAADERHQLYVQWLNARASTPDVLQLDVIWTAELAAAGWLQPLDGYNPDVEDFLPSAIEANRWQGALYALPWFVDVGMLYWRTDLLDGPPASFADLIADATRLARRDGASAGFVWQGARYEGLVTVFLEVLGGFGGSILDSSGRVIVDSPAGVRALQFLQEAVQSGISPRAVLTWQEEQARFAFQNGQALFMRNWPYAYPLLQDPAQSRVAGRVAVAPMPSAPAGEPTAALGGSQLAVNRFSAHPGAAYKLVHFLTRPEQMLERARVVGQLPPRPSLYRGPLEGLLPIDPEQALRVIEAARPRPVSPVYTELSSALQVQLHRALTGQATAEAALAQAAAQMRAILDRSGLSPGSQLPPSRPTSGPFWAILAALLAAAAAAFAWLRKRRGLHLAAPGENERLGWTLVAPALATIALVALFPLAWTFWESLHAHDLRMPWRGREFVGFANYLELAGSRRFWEALGHTLFFTLTSVGLEMTLGLILALALTRAFRGRGLVRAAVLVPWAIPTVVAAVVWRFLFDSQAGVVHAALVDLGVARADLVWFVDAAAAWVPVILADVWKTTPFVVLLLLAGLQGIDESLYEAARVDGASAFQQFRFVTLPLLRPALLVALLFRTLDAVRVFDLVYVMTGGGPGTATEPVTLLTFHALMQNLRFGYGSALGLVVFLVTFALAVLYLRLLGAELTRGRP